MLCWRQGCVGGGVGCSILDTCLQEPLGGSGPCGAGGSRMLDERCFPRTRGKAVVCRNPIVISGSVSRSLPAN